MQSESTQSTKNTSLIDEIYDEILLKEAEAKNKKYNENNYINDGASLVINGKKVYRASEKKQEKKKRSSRYYYTKSRDKARKKTLKDTKLSKRTLMATFMILVVIPIIIFLGITLGNDRKYYIVSLGIIVCTMIPFFMVF